MFTYMVERMVGWYSVHIVFLCTCRAWAQLHTLLSPIDTAGFILVCTDVSFRDIWCQGNKNVNYETSHGTVADHTSRVFLCLCFRIWAHLQCHRLHM